MCNIFDCFDSDVIIWILLAIIILILLCDDDDCPCPRKCC